MGQNESKPVRLKPAAVLDLEDIWTFSADRWSIDQADDYIGGLHAAFERLAENPAIVRERSEFDPPVRIYTFKSHIVVFRDEGDHLVVIRVRHGTEDWMSDPVGDD